MKKKSNKDKGSEFENRCKNTINSGALLQKGDLVTSEHCIEIKFTEKKGFRVSTKIVEKIWGEALDSGKLPLLIIGIKDNDVIYKLTCTITKERI